MKIKKVTYDCSLSRAHSAICLTKNPGKRHDKKNISVTKTAKRTLLCQVLHPNRVDAAQTKTTECPDRRGQFFDQQLLLSNTGQQEANQEADSALISSSLNTFYRGLSKVVQLQSLPINRSVSRQFHELGQMINHSPNREFRNLVRFLSA